MFSFYFMRRFYRLMLGKGGVFSKECFDSSFIGADFISEVDLSEDLRTLKEKADKMLKSSSSNALYSSHMADASSDHVEMEKAY